MTKDVRDKQTAVHGIAYDMSESLVGINKMFASLDPGKLNAKERQSLSISKRQVHTLAELIRELEALFTPAREES